MIDVEVTCRVCGIAHTPDRAALTRAVWRTCAPCRAAVREHAARSMQRLGYAPPDPENPNHDALLGVWDARWNQELVNAERFLVRVHELEREAPDDAA